MYELFHVCCIVVYQLSSQFLPHKYRRLPHKQFIRISRALIKTTEQFAYIFYQKSKFPYGMFDANSLFRTEKSLFCLQVEVPVRSTLNM